MNATCTFCGFKGHLQVACNKKYMSQKQRSQPGRQQRQSRATPATGDDLGTPEVTDEEDDHLYQADDTALEEAQANQKQQVR